MFNLSGSELIFLVIIALVVLGPDKLPEAMRKAGKAYADFKKMTTGFQNEMKSVLDEPMREIRETAELAKNSAMFDTKPFTDSLKDLGNTVTKPVAKPDVTPVTKPVSGSMAAVTPAKFESRTPAAAQPPVEATPVGTEAITTTVGDAVAVDVPATGPRATDSNAPDSNAPDSNAPDASPNGRTAPAAKVALWPVEPPAADHHVDGVALAGLGDEQVPA